MRQPPGMIGGQERRLGRLVPDKVRILARRQHRSRLRPRFLVVAFFRVVVCHRAAILSRDLRVMRQMTRRAALTRLGSRLGTLSRLAGEGGPSAPALGG